MLTIYGALVAAIGTDARLPGPVWAVFIVWICAQAAGFAAAKVHILSHTPGSCFVLMILRSTSWQNDLPHAQQLVVQAGLPPTVGMVGVGLLLRNLPGGILKVSKGSGNSRRETAAIIQAPACMLLIKPSLTECTIADLALHVVPQAAVGWLGPGAAAVWAHIPSAGRQRLHAH